MSRVYALSLSLVLLVGIAGRAEAATVNVFPFFTASGGFCPPGADFLYGGCIRYNQSGYSPVGFSQQFGMASFSVGASGSFGFLESHVSILFLDLGGGGQARGRIVFNISEPAQINLFCSAHAGGFGNAGGGLTNLTTGQSLFGCFAAHNPVSASGSFILNNTDTYEVFTQASLSGTDAVFGHLNFGIPGVTQVNVFVPEPSAFYLLGMGLTSLGLIRSRMRWKGAKRAVHEPA
jgi:hypothetical protein